MRPTALSSLLKNLADAPPDAAWDHALAPGAVVGRFELTRELGRGGFGVVYEARDRELGRAVAFKAIRPGREAGEEGAGENLLREAEAIARLSHPNLVTLYDVGRCEQGPFLVLELLRGSTLKERLALGPMAVPEALRVATEIARGLAHAHAQGVVHRDLKPSNVFLCDGGLVKILDFGMAHAFGRTRLSGGTPAYMAPEQWRGAPEDERTDVFALGVMLHEMLAGEQPLPEGGKSLERGRAPELAVPDLPALGKLVARMLERDPVLRPRHAGEVLAALTAFQDELQRTPTTGTAIRVERRRRAWGRPLALAAAGLVLCAAAAVASYRWLGPAPAAPQRTPCVAVLPFTSLSSSQEDVFFADGIHGELITQLAKIGGLRVIGRSSVEPYQGGARDLKAIASTLGAGTILEGSVQRAGDRVRIAAQLVDPRTGQELWADRFDRKVDDVFAIQTEVALEIARTLGARLTASERALVERPPTRDREAHDLFLRGVYYWGRSTDFEDDKLAHELFTRAVARDPQFALAYAWMAVVETEMARFDGDGSSFLSTCQRARQHAEQALSLQRDLPQAHAAMGEVQTMCEGELAGGIRSYEAAVRGAPGDGVARATLGWLRMMSGDAARGTADLEAAFTIEPRSFWVAIVVAGRLAPVRRFDEAARACARAQEISPGDVHALALCALIPYWQDGNLAPARLALDELPRSVSTRGFTTGLLLQLLSALPERTLELAASGRLADPVSELPLVPRAYVVGRAHAALGHAAEARAAFASALGPLEAHVRRLEERRARAPGVRPPGDGLEQLLLGRAYAGVGRADDALREARRALEVTADQQSKSIFLPEVAEVALALGRREEAVGYLEQALRRPDGQVTRNALRLDPRFASLRGHPRFDALIAGN